MIINFIRAIFQRQISSEKILLYPRGKRIYKGTHGLSRDRMDIDALKVIYRLNNHGYRAYLVGGCVRDMILKQRPKDYDIVTSATPEKIRSIFANSRSVGRRFRIIHIFFRNEKIIEVSTFRSLPRHSLQKRMNRSYLIRRDNRYGTPQEDASRRDFTVNGLYYDQRNETIIDYVGGFEDIKGRRLRSINDPNISFQEDPVRMLRMAKFSAILGLKIDAKIIAATRRHRNEIRKVNASRILDEFTKIFRTGKSADIFSVIYELDLLKPLLPETYKAGKFKSEYFSETGIGQRLKIADQNLAEREELTVIIFIALLLADIIKDVLLEPDFPNKSEYIRKRIMPLCKRMAISTRDRERLLYIFMSHERLLRNPEDKKTRPDLFRKKIFFYEAFMFFKIYSLSTNNEENIQKAMFWEIGPRMAPPERHTTISTFPALAQQRSRERAMDQDQYHIRGIKTERGNRSARTERDDRSTRTERANRSARTERDDRNAKTERDDRSTKTERANRSAKTERDDRSTGTERANRSARTESANISTRTERANRSARTERANRSTKTERDDRSTGTERANRSTGTERANRSTRTERANRSAKTERDDRSTRTERDDKSARTESANRSTRTEKASRGAGTDTRRRRRR